MIAVCILHTYIFEKPQTFWTGVDALVVSTVLMVALSKPKVPESATDMLLLVGGY